MNTFLARANTIFAFTLTVLAALTFGCFLTTAFNDHGSTVVIESTTALVYVKRNRADFGVVVCSL